MFIIPEYIVSLTSKAKHHVRHDDSDKIIHDTTTLLISHVSRICNAGEGDDIASIIIVSNSIITLP